jgi:glutathione S-transferase
MLKLFHNDMSVCAQKVRLALAEIGLKWESQHLKLRTDEQLRPEFLFINPKGQVPALIDGGVVIVESTVINEYLADAFQGSLLLPKTPASRAKMRWWTRQLDDDVHVSVGIVSQSVSFMHQYLKKTPDMLEQILTSIPEEARREIKRKAFATGMDNPDLPMAARRMYKLLGDMDEALIGSEWLVDGCVSLADVGLLPYVLRMEHLNQPIMFEGRPHLISWLARMKARPSYAIAIEQWLNSEYLHLMKKTGAEVQPRVSQMLND